MDPTRSEPVVFAATEYVTVPFEVPLVLPVSVMKSGLPEDAVQLHPLPATVTLTDPDDPPAGIVTLNGLTVTPQAALCVTVKVKLATVMEAERDAVMEFGAAVKSTRPLPAPVAGEVIDSQSVPPATVRCSPCFRR